MPHDRHGRLLEAGDFIKTPILNQVDHGKRQVVGHIKNITTSQQCSGQVVFPVMGGQAQDYFNAADAELLMKADGSDPLPASVDATAD